MHAAAIIVTVALAGLTAGQGTHFNIVRPKLDLGAVSLNKLALRQSDCDIGTPCGTGCAPVGGECCDKNEGYFCQTGNRCYNGGCCPIGVRCRGQPSGCDGGEVECGGICLPEGSDCCSRATGEFCEPGTTCSSDGTCDTGSGGSGGSSGGGSSGGDDQTTDVILPGPTDTSGGSRPTKSYVLVPTTPSPTSGSGSGSSDSDTDSTSSSDSNSAATTTAADSAATTSDEKAAATTSKNEGAINGPNILAGLVAALPLVL